MPQNNGIMLLKILIWVLLIYRHEMSGVKSSAHRLQHDAAKLLSEVKSLYRTSQRAIDYFVKGVDHLLNIQLDIMKEHLDKKLSMRDGYLEVSEVKSAIDTLRGQSLFAGVRSSAQLDKFIAQQLCVDPEKKLIQVIFNSKMVVDGGGKPKAVPKEYGYYVPFLPSLEQLMQCKDVLDCLENPKPAPVGEYKSVTDGLWYRNHKVVKDHGNKVIAIIIYVDDVEFTEPCKSKVKKHRLRLYYWTLANLSPKLRSKLKAINLLALTTTSLAKKYGNEPFISDFLEDMKLLENGVTFKVCGAKEQIYYGILLCCCGDTPQQSNMGGFKESHFALRPCRFCMVTKFKMCDKFVEDPALIRTLETHKLYLSKLPQSAHRVTAVSNVLPEAAVQEDEDDIEVMQVDTEEPEETYTDHANPSINYGINNPSCLSGAPGWDDTKSLPIDTMHVLMEGCVELLCRLIIKDLVTKPPEDKSKKKQDQLKAIYSLEYINKVIDEMSDFGHLSVNKPSKIEPGHLKNKLRQSAAQMHLLLLFLPFITHKHLPEEKQNLLIQLIKIVELSMLFHVKEDDIRNVEKLVENFGSNFVTVYPSHKTLKLHSLRHLPMNMRLYGVLRQVWCFRFEAFHRVFTSLVDVVNNMKNIQLSMSSRYILKRDTEIATAKNGEFFAEEDIYSGCKTMALNDLPADHCDLVEHLVNVGETVTSVDTVTSHCNTWRENVVVMLKNNGVFSQFAALKKIYIIDGEVVFICSGLTTMFDEERNAFSVTGCSSSLSAIRLIDLSDPYPITKFTFNFRRSSVSHLLVTRPIEM